MPSVQSFYVHSYIGQDRLPRIAPQRMAHRLEWSFKPSSRQRREIIRSVRLDAMRKRVKALQAKIERLRAANREYLSHRLHTTAENLAHRQRELRLEQILNELSQHTRNKINAGIHLTDVRRTTCPADACSGSCPIG